MTNKPEDDQVHDADFEEVPFEQGMTLLPGQSTSITIPVTILDDELVEGEPEGMVLRGRDITHEVYDRYAEMTLDQKSGLWYSDVDCTWSGIRPGALPCPKQDTPELTAKALDMWCRSDEIAPGGYKQMVAEARANYKPRSERWVNPVVRVGRAADEKAKPWINRLGEAIFGKK